MGGSNRWRTDCLIGVMLVAATWAVYAQTARFDFILYDDPAYIFENPAVRKGLTLDTARWAFVTFEQSNWHPLTWLSYLTDTSLLGVRAGAYHVVNVIFHTCDV